MPRHEIVVCTENNHYMAWQSMLFHPSCVRLLGQAPIFMVHTTDQPLLPGFERIRAAGGRLQMAPNYREINGVSYPPRNTSGTLRHVQTDADYIVLCDPDMVFLQPWPWTELTLKEHQISFDLVGDMDPDRAVYQPSLDDVCRRAGVDPQRLRNPLFNGGVPHVIPIRQQQPLSELWLEMMELFPNVPPVPITDGGTPSRGSQLGKKQEWLCSMWALIIAAERLNLEPVLTRHCISTLFGGRPLPPLTTAGPWMIHYCYDEDGFRKRGYNTAVAAERDVWTVAPDDGTVCGNIRAQLLQAREFYGLF